MKSKLLILLCVLTIPAAAFAERPTTRPGKGEGFGGKFMRRENFMPGPKATQQEIDDTMAFAKAKFPNHYDLFSRIPDGTPFKNMVIQKMVSRYRQLMRMQEQNPDIYDAMLKQATAEDDA